MQLQVPDVATVPREIESPREDSVRRLAIRRRVLAVAKHKFARLGYAGVTSADLVRAADVSWEEFEVHFDDKDQVLEAVLDQGWKALAPRLAEIAFGTPSARAGMLALLALVAKILQEDEDWIRLMLFEGRRPDPDSGEMWVSNGYRKFQHICTELVMRGQKEGVFRPEYHPRVAASLLVGAIEGIMRDRLMAEQQDAITPYSGTYLMSAFDGLVSYLGLQQGSPT